MRESEITADLNKVHFHSYLHRFTAELGKSQLVRRISFMILQRGTHLDNRIKITNGQAMIVQKLRNKPNDLGKRINEEIEIVIPSDLDSVKKAITAFTNFYSTFDLNPLKLIIQHESYLWTTSEYELKLSRQFGKADLYVYEIETFGAKTPEAIQQELGITADYDAFSDARQALRRDAIDIPLETVSSAKLEQLIKRYLSYH